MNAPHACTADQARTRLHELTVIDVRTPGEYTSGRLPGAHSIPLDQLGRALPAIGQAAGRGGILLVCASGARSAKACEALAAAMSRTAPGPPPAPLGAWSVRSASPPGPPC